VRADVTVTQKPICCHTAWQSSSTCCYALRSLIKNHDTCSLILDDVTVHANLARMRDILNLLLNIAAHRKVILFTQEEQGAA
jgi:uncharacterized protein YhaN